MENQPGLVRGFGLLEATALNMSNMVGVGPFITIPLIIAAMGGPQCMLGWLLGAVLAMCDGLVWSELAAAMPGTGGSYLYLREALRQTRLGGLLPFLFIWQFVFSGPLEIGSGYIGFVQYVSYFWRGMSAGQGRWIVAGVGVLVILLLYRQRGPGFSAQRLHVFARLRDGVGIGHADCDVRVAASAVTVLVLWTALASVFALLLGYSRIPMRRRWTATSSTQGVRAPG
jgi:amino acid transporter